jgi:hypothetical protein
MYHSYIVKTINMPEIIIIMIPIFRKNYDRHPFIAPPQKRSVSYKDEIKKTLAHKKAFPH